LHAAEIIRSSSLWVSFLLISRANEVLSSRGQKKDSAHIIEEIGCAMCMIKIIVFKQKVIFLKTFDMISILKQGKNQFS
ncbi:hypothetical protein ACQP3C_29555, partial [Escherichia coli]